MRRRLRRLAILACKVGAVLGIGAITVAFVGAMIVFVASTWTIHPVFGALVTVGVIGGALYVGGFALAQYLDE